LRDGAVRKAHLLTSGGSLTVLFARAAMLAPYAARTAHWTRKPLCAGCFLQVLKRLRSRLCSCR